MGQEETQCRGHDVNLTPEQRGQITDCLKEAGISSIWKIPAEKLAVSIFLIIRSFWTTSNRIQLVEFILVLRCVHSGEKEVDD